MRYSAISLALLVGLFVAVRMTVFVSQNTFNVTSMCVTCINEHRMFFGLKHDV